MSALFEAKLPNSFSNEIESFSPNLIVVWSNVTNLEMEKKKFVCHHSAFMKAPPEENKRSISKNANCMATINIKFKSDTAATRKNDSFAKKLKEKINVYEDSGITICFCEEPFAVIILTPIMKRAHNLKSSGEIVFVDSTSSSCDPDNHSITFMLCPCSAVAVPPAVIITKGQTEESYVKGFQLLNEAL
ncbi:hypothetical protein AVEN_197434-1 [Araneus ventricosus]|uniref:Uncharacterized protein n=1 Tax=Araneus ventricosus TaxID=182803 RepID=A0A4Y2IBI2_ARAVE|nr:hypothetical protein AVEN_197434-1 [Araneus ventricosus]